MVKKKMSDNETLSLVEKSVDMLIEIATEKSEILALSQN